MTKVNGALMVPVLAALLLSTITVAGESKSALRSQIVKAENEYFALYNKLNTDRQYDMICRVDRPTGSFIDVRVCQPRFMLKAKESSASDRMQAAVSSASSSGSANSRGPDVGSAVAASGTQDTADKQEAFRKNMLDILQKSEELQALGKKRDELQARLDAIAK